jgi:DNA-binding XRE family transcriptional regulator
MNIKEQLLNILKTKDHSLLVSKQVINYWEKPNTNPNLKTIEKVIEANDLDVFISDGNLNELIAFNKKIAEKNGFKMNLVFEV